VKDIVETFKEILEIGIVRNIILEIKQYQKEWLQHVDRMDTDRIPKQALKYRPKGKRSIGRPRKRWKGQFHLEGKKSRHYA
jgi:hypothetical protein